VVGSLGSALRELVDAAVRTEVDEAELAAVEAVVREQTARLRAVARELTGIAAVDDPETGERWYSPVYGPGNPLSPPLEVTRSAEGRVSARVTVGKAYEGPPGLVHGGVIATLLDHVLARAPRSAGHGGLTGSLTVRYRRPVPLGTPLVLEGYVESIEGRRATARATLAAAADPDIPLAEGEALLVALRAERAAQVFAPTGRAVAAWTARDTD
jgi:acyl-coenzyme A thioesterase PaaI-like protein